MTAVVSTWVAPTRRAQVAGAIGILAVAGLWGLLVPLLNTIVEGPNPFKAGVPYDVGGATIVPEPGWQLGAVIEGSLTTLEKGSTSLGVLPAAEATGSVEEELRAGAAVLEVDTTTTWQVGEPELFTTDGSRPAGRVVAFSPAEVDVTYVVSNGAMKVTLATRTDPASWRALEDEIDAMARSVVFITPATGMVIP